MKRDAAEIQEEHDYVDGMAEHHRNDPDKIDALHEFHRHRVAERRRLNPSAEDAPPVVPPTVDVLHELHRQRMVERERLLTSYLKDPLPPAPLEGIEEGFAEMAEFLKTYNHLDRFPYEFVFLSKGSAGYDEPANWYFRCEWWKAVQAWNYNTVHPGTLHVKAHGTDAQIAAYAEKTSQRYDELRASISEGWNKLHPKIPGYWVKNGRYFAVKWVE
jgi:hypothetical protein